MTRLVCLFSTDQQVDWVLPAAGPEREAGERQEEIGQETTVHASGIFGNLLSLSLMVQKSTFSITFL